MRLFSFLSSLRLPSHLHLHVFSLVPTPKMTSLVRPLDQRVVVQLGSLSYLVRNRIEVLSDSNGVLLTKSLV